MRMLVYAGGRYQGGSEGPTAGEWTGQSESAWLSTAFAEIVMLVELAT